MRWFEVLYPKTPNNLPIFVANPNTDFIKYREEIYDCEPI